MRKKECVAMLLTGGQGSRLYLLTENMAKPAVTFGGKYRIIDFPISNCVNSGIDTVGILTQYQPLVLNEYIGNGQPWDLDRVYGGARVLPPYQASKRADWYKGTANAIYQNLNFINQFDPDYVLILSGDHIYKMDYRKMLEFHKEKNADCTIAVIDVPLSEASRFGIMNTREDMSIYEFEEKPKNPKSTKASMGVYIFNKAKLEKYLIEDEAKENSDNDFGKNVIPAMFEGGERMFAYQFNGYWKDVGTLDSLWEANMDMLGESPVLDLTDRTNRIYSKNLATPPHFVGSGAVINNSIITEGCEIYGTVINSVLSRGVIVERDAIVRDSVIMSDCTISAGAQVDYTIMDCNVTVESNATVGKPREEAKKITLIGKELTIGAGKVVEEGTMLTPEMAKSL
ncbi:MAG: glucose-1-phosphate adenylyltransferase [Clostridia bacterium]|nr:glucose-1-phosphate adenylyltransferase [Clostridia bacterium]